MNTKPDFFYINVRNRKSSNNNSKTIKTSPLVRQQKPLSDHVKELQIRNLRATAGTKVGCRSPLPSNTNMDLINRDFEKDIPILLAKFASENEQLIKERQSLFQKNCELVNKIKAFQKVGNDTKIKHLKSLEIPRQEFLIETNKKNLSPKPIDKNTNNHQKQKKKNKIPFINKIKNGWNSPIQMKKSPKNNLFNSTDLNTTKKQIYSNTLGSNLTQKQYNQPTQDLYNKNMYNGKKLFMSNAQNFEISETDKLANFYNSRKQSVREQMEDLDYRKLSKTQHFGSQIAYDQQTKQSTDFIKTLTNQSNKSTSVKNQQYKPYKFEECQLDFNQFSRKTQKKNISQQLVKQSQGYGYQDAFRKKSSNYTQSMKNYRKNTGKVPTILQQKLQKIRIQNNLLRKQLNCLN